MARFCMARRGLFVLLQRWASPRCQRPGVRREGSVVFGRWVSGAVLWKVSRILHAIEWPSEEELECLAESLISLQGEADDGVLQQLLWSLGDSEPVECMGGMELTCRRGGASFTSVALLWQSWIAEKRPAARALPAAPPPKEVGGDTCIVVSGCSHAVVGNIVNGSYVRTAENHGKPVYKKTEQTKDGVDVHIYFWDDKQNPTFCGWWFGPRVGAEEVWAYNPGRMLGTAPLGGWKVPYDGPVDTNFTISVDRKASDEDRRLKKEAAAKIQAEVTRAAKQIRLVAQKLATVKIETLESLEEELTAVLDKELEACGDEKAKVKEECDRALEQAAASKMQSESRDATMHLVLKS
ncbi:ACC1 [Symbiodinium sp. CCMP2592]|nr:ACC1 [Symbiodinium sp. CCMP2592]